MRMALTGSSRRRSLLLAAENMCPLRPRSSKVLGQQVAEVGFFFHASAWQMVRGENKGGKKSAARLFMPSWFDQDLTLFFISGNFFIWMGKNLPKNASFQKWEFFFQNMHLFKKWEIFSQNMHL